MLRFSRRIQKEACSSRIRSWDTSYNPYASGVGLIVSPRGAVAVMDGTSIIFYVDAEGHKHECTPEQMAFSVDTLMEGAPVRSPKSYKGQRHLPGWYWFATTGKHVYFESRLELQVLRMLDFDTSVVAVKSQPFCLTLPGTASKKPRSHVPDYFARCSSGPDRVIDVKVARRAAESKFRQVAADTNLICDKAGWAYEVVTGYDPVLLANVEWLSGYRQKPVMLQEISVDLLGVFEQRAETTIENVLQDALYPVLARPVLFHLMWRRVLSFDVSKPLSSSSALRLAHVGGERAA